MSIARRFAFFLPLLLSPLAVADQPVPLDALATEVLTLHPELRFYEAEIAAAKAGRRAAAVMADPELSLELGQKRVREPGGALAGEGLAWSVTVSQTFEWPGRLALRKSIANRDLELAELGLEQFRRALLARARSLAHAVAIAQAKADAAREVSLRYQALREILAGREPGGLTPVLELRVIEAQEISLRRRAAETALAAHEAAIELNQLRGAALTDLPALAMPRFQFAEAPAVDDLLKAARENNVSHRIRQLELAQHADRVSLAQNERYPSITVSPFYEEERAGERESLLGVGVSLPLPFTSRTKGAVDLAHARRQQAEAALRAAERTLEREVAATAAAYATHRASLQSWRTDTVEHFREAADLADRHYRLGAVPLATYVELQGAYLEAITSLLDTRHDALVAAGDLEQLTGLSLPLIETQP